MTINCKGKLVDLSKPKVMGILNLTFDSFYSGSRLANLEEALQKSEQMLNEGADFLDVGGMSTRPGSEAVSEEEELKRVVPVIEAIKKEFPSVLISIDTYRSSVTKAAVEAGAVIVNDISAGSMDAHLFATVAELKVPYILMHMQGTPTDMQLNPNYENVVLEVNQFFSKKIRELTDLGVNDIIIDPGFGFGKNLEHNYELLNQLDLLTFGDYPILAGLSRKSMIYKLLGTTPTEALNGTTVLNTISLLKGAKILRVHDVKEAVEAVKLVEAVGVGD